ncbi:fructosamine kinase family protein [Actinoplanes sp. NPDC024001]|uniref:fructosamine kinase family protein n=1 Tax=Actinoplanes sp. NPDC024001 TaxID=3154598 RepID=UPI0033F888EC
MSLAQRLRAVGYEPTALATAPGGVIASAALVTLADGSRVFAKTLDGADVFTAEADGLRALATLGGATTPRVLLTAPDLLVLEALHPALNGEDFWERAGRMLAGVHTSAVSDRFGWHTDGWLGRLRQHNTWTTDGYEFFARHRILRWLTEPLVSSAFDAADRAALERLCTALPEIIPPQPPVLNHGDLWPGNVLSTADGSPAFIDPAVSYTWAESDLSMMWSANRPPESDRFFPACAEVAPLRAGWRERMPILHLRELLSIIAHGDDDWGAVAAVREVIAPFARR